MTPGTHTPHTAAPTPTRAELAAQLIRSAASLSARGLLLATSGNLSARLSPEHFLITASGRDKGALTPEDFLVCDLDGAIVDAPPGARPSAETLVHCVLYAHDPTIGSIVHVHDPHAALCSDRDAEAGATTLHDVEMIKALGNWADGATIHIPILPNPAHIPTLAEHVRAEVQRPAEGFRTPAVNILRHGTYAWGPTVFDAHRHTEALHYLFQYSYLRTPR